MLDEADELGFGLNASARACRSAEGEEEGAVRGRSGDIGVIGVVGPPPPLLGAPRMSVSCLAMNSFAAIGKGARDR